MNRTTGILAGAVGLLLTMTGPARADDTATPPPTGGTTETVAPASPSTQTAPSAAPAAEAIPSALPGTDPAATPAGGATDPLASVRAGAAKIDPKASAKFESALQPIVSDVEKSSTADGDRRVAERLAAEFAMTPDALLAEKSELKAGWGQLMIAHALLANSTTDLTARQLFDLKNEGMSWGQIATGMGFVLGDVLRASKEEAKVAKGLAKPDGRSAEIHGTASKAGSIARPAKREKTANAAASKASDTDKATSAEGAKAAADGVKAAEEGVKAAEEGVKTAAEEKK